MSVVDERPPDARPSEPSIAPPPIAGRWWSGGSGRGHQAYVVYPLVEESDKAGTCARPQMAEEWRAALPRAHRLLHGRLKGPEEQVMGAFYRAESTRWWPRRWWRWAWTRPTPPSWSSSTPSASGCPAHRSAAASGGRGRVHPPARDARTALEGAARRVLTRSDDLRDRGKGPGAAWARDFFRRQSGLPPVGRPPARPRAAAMARGGAVSKAEPGTEAAGPWPALPEARRLEAALGAWLGWAERTWTCDQAVNVSPTPIKGPHRHGGPRGSRRARPAPEPVEGAREIREARASPWTSATTTAHHPGGFRQGARTRARSRTSGALHHRRTSRRAERGAGLAPPVLRQQYAEVWRRCTRAARPGPDGTRAG